MLTVGWLLVVVLSAGGPSRVIRVDSEAACVARSQLEMRLDPRVRITYCHIGLETEA